MSSFKEKIEEYVDTDNKLRDLKTKKDKLKQEVLSIVKIQNLSNNIIKTSNSEISFGDNKSIGGITITNVQKTLEKYLSDKNLRDTIMNDIKNNRTEKYTFDIKRTFNK